MKKHAVKVGLHAPHLCQVCVQFVLQKQRTATSQICVFVTVAVQVNRFGDNNAPRSVQRDDLCGVDEGVLFLLASVNCVLCLAFFNPTHFLQAIIQALPPSWT